MDTSKIRELFEYVKRILTAKTEDLIPKEAAVEKTTAAGAPASEETTAAAVATIRTAEARGTLQGVPSGDARLRANATALKMRGIIRRVLPSSELTDMCLTIMYANDADGLCLESPEFRNAFDLMIESGFDSEFHSVTIRKKDGPDTGIEVDKDIYISITRAGEKQLPEPEGNGAEEPEPEQPAPRPVVRISAVPNNGSLREESYTIDSPGQYDIGAGTDRRRNFIVINDDENDPQYKKNAYVSRNHAHIEYCDDGAVLLFADQGGTRFNHKRTHLMRGGKMEEIESTYTPKALVDNDIIILSKYVQIKVEISFENK